MKQTEQVLEYLKQHGSIDPLRAFNDLGILRLGARIYDLKAAGGSHHRGDKDKRHHREALEGVPAERINESKGALRRPFYLFCLKIKRQVYIQSPNLVVYSTVKNKIL